MTIYDRIRERRIELNMTQDELAKAVGYKDRSMVTKIERGEVDLSQTKIAKFAEALGVSESYLMGWKESPMLNLVSPSYPIHPSILEMLNSRINETPQEDAKMVTLWRNASLTAKRAAIAVLESMKEENLK